MYITSTKGKNVSHGTKRLKISKKDKKNERKQKVEKCITN